MADEEEFLTNLKTLADSVGVVEERLQPFLNPLDHVSSGLDHVERARLYVTMAYAVNTLLFTYLRVNGAVKGHPVRKELGRIKEYMEKVERVMKGPEKRKMKVDQDAAKRFVKHGLQINDNAEKEAQNFLDSLNTKAEQPVTNGTVQSPKRSPLPSAMAVPAAGEKRSRNDAEDEENEDEASQPTPTNTGKKKKKKKSLAPPTEAVQSPSVTKKK